MFSQPLRAFQIETSKFPPGTILLHEKPPIRSLHTDEGRIVLGTGHDDIIQIFADGSMEIVLQVELLEIILGFVDIHLLLFVHFRRHCVCMYYEYF